MTDIVERLRTDVLWHQRRGNETIAADCREAADEIERLRAALADRGKPQQRAKHVCDDPLCAVCGHPWAPPEVPQ